MTTTADIATPPAPFWIPLPAGHLPCVSCGVGVAGPHAPEATEEVSMLGRYESELLMTRCPICTMIQQTADDLLAAHPGVVRRIGARSIALHRLEIGLTGLDVLGVNDAAVIDRLTHKDGDVARVIEYMAVPGGMARWVARFSPMPTKDARPETVAGDRWAHVTDVSRRALRRAYVDLAAARYERPVMVLCPSDDGSPSGCMLCGVGAIETLPSRANDVWFELSADPQTIGGREAPDSIDGCVCVRCDTAVDTAGGVGQSAMRLSVLTFLDIPSHLQSVSQLDGIVGWGVLRGATPNSEPWEHVDLRALRDEVRT